MLSEASKIEYSALILITSINGGVYVDGRGPLDVECFILVANAVHGPREPDYTKSVEPLSHPLHWGSGITLEK